MPIVGILNAHTYHSCNWPQVRQYVSTKLATKVLFYCQMKLMFEIHWRKVAGFLMLDLKNIQIKNFNKDVGLIL